MGKAFLGAGTDRDQVQATDTVRRTSSFSEKSSGGVSAIPLASSGTTSTEGDFSTENHHDGSTRLDNGGQPNTYPSQPSDPQVATTYNVILSNNSTDPPIPLKSEAPSDGDSAIALGSTTEQKPPISLRFKQACRRALIHTKNALLHSWMNVLLVFVPAGIIVRALNLNASAVFAINAIAIVPLAGLLTYATESVARRLGDTLGALLNVSFGNAVELIIFIIALAKNEIRIVQASLLGSILSNLLLILGMAFLLGGLRYREQIYNSTVTQMSACLLSLSVMSLLLPTAFHASFNEASSDAADVAVLRVSRGTSVILLLVYILYLMFQLKSHSYLYESTPQSIIDEESHPGLLADVLGSSSSSDDSDSSSSSDSDTSGSILTTGKRLRKKMFRRRRKSNASASSHTRSSFTLPMVSPAPTTEPYGNRWEAQIVHTDQTMEEPKASNPTDETNNRAEMNDDAPRVRDFVNEPNNSLPSTKSRLSKHKHRLYPGRRKHHKQHASRTDAQQVAESEDQHPQTTPTMEHIDEDQPRVEFALDRGGNNAPSSRLAFNVRQLSSRAAFRPTLPKMLSNNVFVRPEPTGSPAAPTGPRTLRRTNSLPDRLNQPGVTFNDTAATPFRGPFPPYQHTQPVGRRAEVTDGTDSEGDETVARLELSRTAAVILLLLSTGLVAVCAEFMVDAIPEMLANNNSVSPAFVGLIILPVVSNAAEHVTAVTVAAKNKMDLAIGVAVGSSIQIALFVTPIVVLLGWILKTEMSLYFNLFETISLFVTAFVVNFLVLDGRSNYLEGSLLIAAYVIIAVGAFYYPQDQDLSTIGGGAAT